MTTKKPTTTARGFIKLMRHDDVEKLVTQRPHAFRLLTIIAWRARRSGEKCKWTNLECGQAFIGDYKACGFTEQTYRTAKRQLSTLQFATFKGTSRGTIATLCSSEVYDINPEADNVLGNDQITDKQRTDNGRITTNKNVKKEKNENKESRSALAEANKQAKEIATHYNNVRGAMPECIKLSAKREAQINARIKEVGFYELKMLITECAGYSLFKGEKGNGWKADLEWITKDSNFTKIREGRYKDNEPPKPKRVAGL